MTKKSRQKIKYLENLKSFSGEPKRIFKGLLVAKNCLKLASAPLTLAFERAVLHANILLSVIALNHSPVFQKRF